MKTTDTPIKTRRASLKTLWHPPRGGVPHTLKTYDLEVTACAEYCHPCLYQYPENSTHHPILYALHWQCINQWVTYKVLLLVYKAINHSGPAYHLDPLSPQSTSLHQAVNHGELCLSSLEPCMWNQMPVSIRTSDSLTAFKTSLNTYHTAFH